MPAVVDPMTAQLAAGIPAAEDRYGFEFKWDGVRIVAFWDRQVLRLQSRNRRDVTGRYPELGSMAEALGAHRAVLDGEVVALDERGRPSFEQLQLRMHLTVEAEIRRRVRDVPVTYLLFGGTGQAADGTPQKQIVGFPLALGSLPSTTNSR